MLKAKLLLSGVKRTSKVVAPIPLLSIHVARDFEPIALIASTEFSKDRAIIEHIKNIGDEDNGMKLRVRLIKEMRIVTSLVIV